MLKGNVESEKERANELVTQQTADAGCCGSLFRIDIEDSDLLDQWESEFLFFSLLVSFSMAGPDFSEFCSGVLSGIVSVVFAC